MAIQWRLFAPCRHLPWLLAVALTLPIAATAATASAFRVAIPLAGRVVVLVAAHERVYAFVDGPEPESAVDGLVVRLEPPGVTLPLDHPAPGLFVAPFRFQGHSRDRIAVTLTTPKGDMLASGTAEIGDEDAANGAMPDAPTLWPAASLFWLLGAAASGGLLRLIGRRPSGVWRSSGKRAA